MKKLFKALGLTLPMLAAIGIVLIVGIFVVIVYYQVYLTNGLFSWLILKDGSSNLTSLVENLPYPSDTLIEYITYFGQIMWMVIFYFWYRKLKNRVTEPKIKLWNVKNIVLIAVIGIGFNLATGGLMELILPHFEELMEQYSEMMESLFMGNPVLLIISIVIFAPIAEELIFRGVILQKALKFSPFIVANILQALLFGIFHMNLVQGIYAFALGLVMGYVSYRFRTLWASIVLHAIYNGSSFVLFAPTSPGQMVACVIVGGVLGTVALILVKRRCSNEVINQGKLT